MALPPDGAAGIEHSNIFVRGLPADLDEDEMRALFQPFGIIDSCRVLRNARSQGYGFVKFSLHHEALTAIDTMNGHVIDPLVGPIEVKFANADPTSRLLQQTPSDNLYIRNLPSSFTEADLAHLFSPFGGVKECRMLPPPLGTSPSATTHTCGGLVRLANPEVATAAIEQLNAGPPLPGSTLPLMVRYADTPEEKLRKAAKKERLTPAPVRGAVTGRSAEVPAVPLPPGFMAFNSQPSGAVYPNRTQGFNGAPVQQGFGMPPQARPPAMVMPYGGRPTAFYTQDAMKLLMLSPQDGNGGSYQAAGRGPPTSLYLKNLPPEADRLYLYEFFAPLGPVQSVRVLEDENGQCRGVGFVNYADNASALAAIQALNGAPVAGGRILHVSLQPPRERSARPA